MDLWPRPAPSRGRAAPVPASRKAAWSALLGLGGVLAASACAHEPPAARPEVVGAPLEGAAPGEPVGELRLNGAWALSANAEGFGGISGATLAGDRLLLASDRSRLFELPWAAEPAAGGAFRVPLLGRWPLADRHGRLLDAEALAVDGDGRRLVADEEGSRVVAFAAGGRPVGDPLPLPELASPAGANTGVEALAVLPDGRSLVALAEGGEEGGFHAGVRVGEGGRRAAFRYRPMPGYRPTDLAVAPPWLFVLERRLSLLGGWQARLAALPLADLPDGGDPAALVEGRELAVISGPRLGENHEALAVARQAEGFRLLLLSDDNFNAFQRTLLLSLSWRVDLPPPQVAGNGPAAP